MKADRAHPSIRIGRGGVEATSGVEPIRAEFRTRRVVRLPGLLSLELAGQFEAAFSKGGFHYSQEPGGLLDVCTSGAVAALSALINDPAVLDFIGAITGRRPLSFAGRGYRYSAQGLDAGLFWHSDLKDSQTASLSITLSAERYEGGVFEMRRASTGVIVASIPNPVPGDALLIGVAPDYEHHVTPVVNGTKITFSGWFRSVSEIGVSSWLERRR